MKSLLDHRMTRVAVAALAAAGLTGSLGAGLAAASPPAVALERSSDAASVADEDRPPAVSQGRKVG